MVADASIELLRDFDVWAQRKSRTVDLMLLDELLRVRSSYDELEPTYWPLDSVEHLLLERLPSKGPVEGFDEEVLTGTLDAYFRFLRSTGRMSGYSADPKALTREVRRHARRIQERVADRVNWSPNKVLMDFGRDIGIHLDDAPDMETLQQRLSQITEAWNALPVADRRRLMPRPGDDMEVEADAMPGREIAMRRFGVDDQVQGLLMTFADSLPTGEMPTPEQVAPMVEKASFIKQLLALAEWIGPGRAVTSTGVLRPAVAHEAYDHLVLGEWTRSQLRREYPDESLPGVAAVGRDAWIEREAERPWSRAADCPALHRLWLAAAAAGLVAVGSSTAVAVGELPGDAEDWVRLGLRACMGLMHHVLDSPYHAVPIIFALMTSYVADRRLVTWDEIVSFHQSWWRTRDEQEQLETRDWLDSHDSSAVRVALGRMADTGLYEESERGVTLTVAGEVFVTAWLRYMEK